MSPILFHILADMLAILIDHAKQDSQIVGMVRHLVDGGLSILQYADDAILFTDGTKCPRTRSKMSMDSGQGAGHPTVITKCLAHQKEIPYAASTGNNQR